MHIANKDLLITVGVILLVFGGIPFLLWGVGHWRQVSDRARVLPVVQTLMQEQKTQAIAVAEKIFQAFPLLDQALTQQPFWRQEGITYDTSYYSRESPVPFHPLYSEISNELDELCKNFRQQLFTRSDFRFRASDGYCSLIVKDRDAVLVIDVNSMRASDSPEYLEDIGRLLLSNDSMPLNIHWHATSRSWHVLALMQKEPIIVWDVQVAPSTRDW